MLVGLVKWVQFSSEPLIDWIPENGVDNGPRIYIVVLYSGLGPAIIILKH